MNYTSLIIRSKTRLRLQFTSALDTTAFTGTGAITIVSLDAIGIDEIIRERLPVSGNTSAMELVLAYELAQGGSYLLTLTGIPGADATTVTTQDKFAVGEGYAKINVEFSTPDVETALYGTDLVWSGLDYVEGTDGDLLTISGRANVNGALQRRLTGEPLPWNRSYGGNIRSYVDSPSASIFTIRGEVLRQMLSDDRVKTATIKLDQTDNVEEATYELVIGLKGASNDSKLVIGVPTSQ